LNSWSHVVGVDIALSPLSDVSGGVVAVIRDATLRRAAALAINRIGVIEYRERISRRVQDHVIHELFAIGLDLQALASQADEPPRQRLDEAISSTDRAIHTLRAVIFESMGLGEVAEPSTRAAV
jgi:signal transduction histidine kinase